MGYFSQDEIVQVATPPGRGLVGALRLSGARAFAVLAEVAEGLPSGLGRGEAARGVHFCRVRFELPVFHPEAAAGSVVSDCVCDALVFLMPGPASYTREDVAEIHLPGSPVVLRAAMEALVKAGARAALPGEFTFRAFRNGRLTLAQAEAVEELVTSGSATERRRALARLGDREAERIAQWRDRVMELAAGLEAALDFSGEELETDVVSGLRAIAADLEKEGLEVSRHGGAAQNELPHIALVGLANAGKSSLLNVLLGGESALVSPRPSTTRDSLRREVDWYGSRFILSDNPGYHPEGEGGGRAAAELAQARLGGEDLACWVIDASRPLGPREEDFASRLCGSVFLVLNKSDLPACVSPGQAREAAGRAGLRVSGLCQVSAVTGVGVAELSAALAEAGRSLTAGPGVWNRREALELVQALEHCRAAVAELSGAGRLELAADDVRLAVGAFSRALGEGYAEEALTRIFSRFCIGK